MKKNIWIVAALLPLLFACERIIPEPDTRVLDFTLEVANENYTQSTVLDGLGDTQIASVTGLPEWITSISRQEELYEGKLALDVTVTADSKLNWNRQADVVIKMKSGATVNLSVNQRPSLPDFNGSFGTTTPSVNKDFEDEWYSQTQIEVVSSVVKINDQVEVKSKYVFLPWAFEEVGVQQHLPDDELQRMMENKYDWALAFNTTGIETAAGANLNYFGLFNRYTHTLRVFYYWPEELIPPSGANDHCWHVSFTGKPAEYNPMAFAVPLQHSLDGDAGYKYQEYANTYYVSPLTDERGRDNPAIVVPRPGWWAFDMDMSAMRQQSFFDSYNDLSKMTIGMDLFDVQNVLLESVMDKVTIQGDLTGSMNLDALIPQSANTAGKVVPSLMSPISSILTNTYFLTAIGNHDIYSPITFIPAGFGLLAGFAGNFTQAFCKNGIDDPEKAKKELGSLNGSLDLHLGGTITTTGTIQSQRSHGIPSLALPSGYFDKIRKNNTFQMGKGVWNIQNDPVVYVVKDAFWANKPVLTYYSRKQQTWYRMGNEVAEYDISASPTSLGLRVISFFDPTSLGDVVLNDAVFGDITDVRVGVSYGVYPGGDVGNTDAFRSAVELNYEPMSLATDKKADRASTGDVAGTSPLPFKIFKDPCTKGFFQMPMDEEATEKVSDLLGNRLSAQLVNDNYERRYYGTSLYFMNPDASSSMVDIVQYVSDPQIYVPFNETRRVITDPDLPDMVVSVQLRVESTSPGQEEPTIKVYRLRYVPKIVYINAEDVPAVYQQMVDKANGGMSPNVEYATLNQQLALVKAYADEIAAQLKK
jgi:hypothetical protein